MGMEVHTDISRLLEMLTASGNHYDIEKINNAYAYAAKMHEGQFRASGEPYISHPIAVAEIVAGLGLDTDSICAALLHDTVEDAGTHPEEIRHAFGEEVLRLVLFDTEDKTQSWEERKRRTLHALKNCDRPCAMLVCADKLANIRDIVSGLAQYGESIWSRFHFSREKQKWLYQEYVAVLERISDLKMYDELKTAVDTVFMKEDSNHANCD